MEDLSEANCDILGITKLFEKKIELHFSFSIRTQYLTNCKMDQVKIAEENLNKFELKWST